MSGGARKFDCLFLLDRATLEEMAERGPDREGARAELALRELFAQRAFHETPPQQLQAQLGSAGVNGG